MYLKKHQNIKTKYIGWRFNLLKNLIFTALLCLILRLTYLQIINSEYLINESNKRSLRVQRIPITRGMISDRSGHLLAVSVPVNAIWVDPKELNKYGGINSDPRWKALSNALSIPLDQLSSKININPKLRFLYLARQVHLSIGDYISKLKLPGVYLSYESRRYYPAGQITAHIIGITNIDNQGIEGIEKSFNLYLTGRPGSCMVRKDRLGKIIEYISCVNSQAAQNIVLSIDERLQFLVYRELNKAVKLNQAESGIAVLIDINTGEILSMTNIPSYNPNNLNNVSSDMMRNRSITDIFEPGSTVKPMVAITALQKGIIEENTILNTLPYVINGHQIKDVIQYNKLTIAGILQKSSNVGISKLALAMPSSVLVDTYLRFGLGKITNLGLIGENSGIFPKKQNWSNIEKAIFSYGYGLMVTPLQLAQVYAIIGGMGIKRPLSIIRINHPVVGERIIPESFIRIIIRMMESVALPGGGGTKAAIKGYRVAIKTGTVKKIGPNGNYINKYVAYTAGIAPASNPKFALVVIINDPKCGKYYGGAVSAPVFGSIMNGIFRIMNIIPDKLDNNIKNIIINN